MRKISNSEVSTWNSCQRRYHYEYDLNLTPIVRGKAISTGILGHTALAAYYQARKDGATHDNAVDQAISSLNYAVSDPDTFEVAMDVNRILTMYFNGYGDEIGTTYKVVEVEQQHDVPLTAESTYSMRLDALMFNLKTGKLELWDHKFVYDFWNFDKLNLSGQFPKYVGALKFDSKDIDVCVLNQLRYRKLKGPSFDDLFKRTVQQPSPLKVKRALKEQVIATQEILTWRELPIGTRGDLAKRVLSPMVCNFCPYKNPCMAEFDGNDLKFVLQNEFTTKTDYGYNAPTVEDEM